MPVKELKVSFSISVEALAQALATSNSGMQIDVLATDDTPQIAKKNGHSEPKLLPPPSGDSCRALMLSYLRHRPNNTVMIHSLRLYAAEFNFNDQQVYNALLALRYKGLVRKYGRAKYRISKKGLKNG